MSLTLLKSCSFQNIRAQEKTNCSWWIGSQIELELDSLFKFWGTLMEFSRVGSNLMHAYATKTDFQLHSSRLISCKMIEVYRNCVSSDVIQVLQADINRFWVRLCPTKVDWLVAPLLQRLTTRLVAGIFWFTAVSDDAAARTRPSCCVAHSTSI
jgi:hypothetical protein